MNKAAENFTPSNLTTVFEYCPKCQGLLSAPEIIPTSKGLRPVYTCADCDSSFVLVPVTCFEFFEVKK